MLEYLAESGAWWSDGHEALMCQNEQWGWLEGIDYLVILNIMNLFYDSLHFFSTLMGRSHPRLEKAIKNNLMIQMI